MQIISNPLIIKQLDAGHMKQRMCIKHHAANKCLPTFPDVVNEKPLCSHIHKEVKDCAYVHVVRTLDPFILCVLHRFSYLTQALMPACMLEVKVHRD